MLNGPMWQTCHDGLADTEVDTVAPMLPEDWRRSKSIPGVHNGQVFANALLKWTLLQSGLKCNAHGSIHPLATSHGDIRQKGLEFNMSGMNVSVTKLAL